MIFIYITCKDKQEAEKIGLHLVNKRFAACVNIFPQIHSLYWWKGKLAKSKEAVLIVKTVKKNFAKIEKEVKKLHSYSVPCILRIPITKANVEYLRWLKGEVA